jgi:hypothetical protein
MNIDNGIKDKKDKALHLIIHTRVKTDIQRFTKANPKIINTIKFRSN